MTRRMARFAPTLCVLFVALAYLGWVFIKEGNDPLAFAYIGTRFSLPDPGGTEGYDGQFNYFIARDLDPQAVRLHLDVPAYRYQHILYPLLARALAFGIADAIPWTLPALNLLCLALITFFTGELLAERGSSRWGALPLGLWVGLMGAVRLDLAEPLAILLVVMALCAAGSDLDRRMPLVAVLLALAMLAKETVLPFLLGWTAWLVWRRDFRKAAFSLLSLIPFGLLQLWLWWAFGSPGLGSGGAGATPFEIIPFAGMARIAGESWKVLAVLLIVYVPGLLLPAVYGLFAPIADAVRKEITPEAILLFLNALMVALAPFSTFREPLGITRLGCGLILCMWVYTARRQKTWWQKLSLAGIVYLAFIL